MCLPIKFLKTFLGLGTGLTIIAALISLGFGFYLLYLQNQLNESAIFVDDVKLYKDIIQYALIALGAILFVIGLFGMIGTIKKSTCCLFLFQIGALVLTLVFIGGGIATKTLSAQVVSDCNNYESLNLACQQIKWSTDIQQLASGASQVLCTTNCKCYLDPSKFQDQTVLIGLFYDQTDKSLPTQFNQCSVYDSRADTPYAFLDAAEKMFSCAGWCDKSNIYLFTDVNLGNPSSGSACYPQVKTYIEKNGRNLSYVFYGVGILLGLLVISAFCLCFHPKSQRRNSVGYYERMGYNE